MGVFLGPFGDPAHAQKVAVVFEQFFQARPSDIGELDLGFLGGTGHLAIFQDVLFAGAGDLTI